MDSAPDSNASPAALVPNKHNPPESQRAQLGFDLLKWTEGGAPPHRPPDWASLLLGAAAEPNCALSAELKNET